MLPMTWSHLHLIGGLRTRVCGGVKRCHLGSCGLMEMDPQRCCNTQGLLIGALATFYLRKQPRSVCH
jgi:hypothetical protein